MRVSVYFAEDIQDDLRLVLLICVSDEAVSISP